MRESFRLFIFSGIILSFFCLFRENLFGVLDTVKATVRGKVFPGTRKDSSGKQFSVKAFHWIEILVKANSGKPFSGKDFSRYGPFVPQNLFLFSGGAFSGKGFSGYKDYLFVFGVQGTGVIFSSYRDYRVGSFQGLGYKVQNIKYRGAFFLGYCMFSLIFFFLKKNQKTLKGSEKPRL